MTLAPESPEGARAAVAALYADDRAVQAAGITIHSVLPGEVTLELVPNADMGNGHGIVHGGWLCLLADTAFAYALASRGAPGVTVHVDMAFLHPARVGGRLVARAVEYHFDGVAGIYDVSICDERGHRLAAMRAHGRVPRAGRAG